MSIKKSHIVISLVVLSLVLTACIPSAPAEGVADPGGAPETRPEATPGAPPRPPEGDTPGDAPGAGAMPVAGTTADVDYAIVDTGQAVCYDDREQITCPGAGEAFYGQDAQYVGNQPSYTLSADGLTVYDNKKQRAEDSARLIVTRPLAPPVARIEPGQVVRIVTTEPVGDK